MISHAKSKKSMTFADVVKSGKATKTFTPDELKAIKLKTPDQYTMIGQSVPQLDIPSKTNGSAKFGIDVMLPGMVYGKIVMPPVRYGATVKSVDDSAAKKVPGFIKAVTLDDKTGTTTGWVVAVANTYANAKKAADALKVTYDNGPNAKTVEPIAARRRQNVCRRWTIPACSLSRTATPRRPLAPRRKCWRRNTPPASTSMRRWSR